MVSLRPGVLAGDPTFQVTDRDSYGRYRPAAAASGAKSGERTGSLAPRQLSTSAESKTIVIQIRSAVSRCSRPSSPAICNTHARRAR